MNLGETCTEIIIRAIEDGTMDYIYNKDISAYNGIKKDIDNLNKNRQIIESEEYRSKAPLEEYKKRLLLVLDLYSNTAVRILEFVEMKKEEDKISVLLGG